MNGDDEGGPCCGASGRDEQQALLAENPFEPISPERLALIYRWPAEAARFLAGEAECLHVIGERGMGKSALLHQIEERLAASASYVYFPPNEWVDVEELRVAPVTLLDEADRLTAGHLMRLLRRLREARCRVAVATHRSLLRPLRRAGYSCLRLALHRLSRPEDVAQLLDDRTGLAAGTQDHGYEVTLEAARAMLRISKGNIGTCLELGYEVFEDLDEVRPITQADATRAADGLARATRGSGE